MLCCVVGGVKGFQMQMAGLEDDGDGPPPHPRGCVHCAVFIALTTGHFIIAHTLWHNVYIPRHQYKDTLLWHSPLVQRMHQPCPDDLVCKKYGTQ